MRGGGDLADDVGRAAGDIRVEDVGQRLELLGHRIQATPCAISSVTNASDRVTGRDQVDVGAVAGDDAGRLHLGEPRLDGGPGDPGDARQLEVTDAGVLAHRLDERYIELIHDAHS